MKKAGVIVALVVLMATSFAVLTILPANVRAATLYVGGGGPGNYTTIQAAIDAANPGDTIYVYNGTYNENITINKGLSLVGEDRANTIINSSGVYGIRVTADSVGISGFTIDRLVPGYVGSGVYVTNAQDVHIANNTIRKSEYGIRLISSHYNTVANNSFPLGTWHGIFLDSSNANIIANNTILDVWNGIRLHDSGDNTITDNVIQSSQRAILLDSSWNITLTGNVMIEGGIIIQGELIQYWDTHTITVSNLAGGKPVYYWKDAIGGTLPAGAGQVILANCDSITIKNQSFGNGTSGVQIGFSSGITIADNTASDVWMFLKLAFSHDNTISNNTVSSSQVSSIDIDNSDRNTIANNVISNSSWGGLSVYMSDNDLIYDNTIRNNTEYGISLGRLNNSVVANNKVLSNGDGIRLWGSHRNTIDNNTASWNEKHGFYLAGSENTTLSNNNVSHNGDLSTFFAANAGILLDWSVNLALFNNRMIENGIYFWGELIHYITNEIDTSNLVNGKPVHFWKQRNGGTVPANAGQVILADCTDVLVEGQDLNNGTVGVALAFSSANRIANNTVLRNWMGIDLFHSNDNSIHNNAAALNTYGIGLSQSDNNVLYHNNIIDNSNQAYDDTNTNRWDDGYPFGGNYWSDYSGLDDKRGPNQNEPGSDGIGDTPYTIDVDSRDRYPLMNPLGEFIPPEIDFVLINGLPSQTYILPGVPPLVLTAILDDRDTGGSRIGGANLTVGVHNWSSSSQMHASDGSFDSPYEAAYAEVSSPTEPGTYDYCVSAWDADFNFNSTSTACARLTLMAHPSHPVMHDAVLSGSGLRDVTISWIASPDDGAGEDDIAGYFVWRSTTYAGPYIKIAGFPANGSAMYEWTCIGCGKDNPSNYFFYVEATDSILSTPSPNRVGKFTRPLASGPNLVSIPVIISNESIEHILQTVRWNKAWSYHSLSHEWKWFMKDRTYSRGLLSANYTMGIWVNITSDCNLTMAGMVPAQTTIQLYSGWNLVSFPSFNTTYTVADLKAEIGATRVEGYDLVPPNYLRVLGDAEVLQAGYGYWVRVEADTDWIVEVS